MKTIPIILIIGLIAGLAGCGPSTRVKLDPGSQDFYDYARLIMSKQEKDIFNHLPDKPSRDEFIADFWAKRDPDPESEENEFKDEFYRRIEYANKRFNEGVPGWKTDRGRMYIYFGYPDKIDMSLTHSIPGIKGGILIWTYYRYELAIRFIDQYGYGQYKVDPYYDVFGDIFLAMDRAMYGLLPDENGFGRKFIDFKADYDRNSGQLTIRIPPKDLTFREEDGLLKVDFKFRFYIYHKDGGQPIKIEEARSFEATEQKLVDMEEIIFTFSLMLDPGSYSIDTVIFGDAAVGKTRKIFDIKA